MLQKKILVIMIFFCFLLSGCGKLINHYDPVTAQAIGATAKSVDFFYGSLLLENQDNRQYQTVRTPILSVDVAFNALKMHTGMQSNNQETLQMINNTLKLWQKYKEKFQTSNRYSDIRVGLHKKRLHQMFELMLQSELNKK